MAVRSVLTNSKLSVGQKIRWFSLLMRTGRDRRFFKLVEAIYGVIGEDRPVVVDVGANVGNFVRACIGQKTRAAAVIAVEPSFYVFEILNFWSKFWSGHGTKVRCRKVALGEAPGSISINTPMKKSGSLRVGLAYVGASSHANVLCEAVPIMPLDALLAEEGVEDVHLVKMDVEGAEAMVLSGAAHLFETVRPVWYVEIDDSRAASFGSSAADLFAKFIEGGYRAFVFDENLRRVEVTALGTETD